MNIPLGILTHQMDGVLSRYTKAFITRSARQAQPVQPLLSQNLSYPGKVDYTPVSFQISQRSPTLGPKECDSPQKAADTMPGLTLIWDISSCMARTPVASLGGPLTPPPSASLPSPSASSPRSPPLAAGRCAAIDVVAADRVGRCRPTEVDLRGRDGRVRPGLSARRRSRN